MKIRAVQAFAIRSDLHGGPPTNAQRRPVWTAQHGLVDGARGLDVNQDMIARALQRIGNHVDLTVDCWMAFDLDCALSVAERMRHYRLRWIRDCLMPDDLEGLRTLRKHLPLDRLAGGKGAPSPCARP